MSYKVIAKSDEEGQVQIQHSDSKSYTLFTKAQWHLQLDAYSFANYGNSLVRPFLSTKILFFFNISNEAYVRDCYYSPPVSRRADILEISQHPLCKTIWLVVDKNNA
jgi:hypothetical protein